MASYPAPILRNPRWGENELCRMFLLYGPTADVWVQLWGCEGTVWFQDIVVPDVLDALRMYEEESVLVQEEKRVVSVSKITSFMEAREATHSVFDGSTLT